MTAPRIVTEGGDAQRLRERASASRAGCRAAAGAIALLSPLLIGCGDSRLDHLSGPALPAHEIHAIATFDTPDAIDRKGRKLGIVPKNGERVLAYHQEGCLLHLPHPRSVTPWDYWAVSAHELDHCDRLMTWAGHDGENR